MSIHRDALIDINESAKTALSLPLRNSYSSDRALIQIIHHMQITAEAVLHTTAPQKARKPRRKKNA